LHLQLRVSRTCGPKGQEVTGGWSYLHTEVRILYPSQIVIMVIRSRRMGCAGRAACMGRWDIFTKTEREYHL